MKLKCALTKFQVDVGTSVDLSQRSTKIAKLYDSKRHYRSLLKEYRQEISDLQSVLYAHNRYALLIILQGMDTAGKGGTIKHVMSGVNPQGCQVFNFGPPSSEELDHDFLWRTNKRLPERGRIGIFDRSYYEEVLVVRAQPQLLDKQRLPKEFVDRETLWHERFQDIVNLESFLTRNGTRIVKLFLHLSRDEQKKRLLSRIDEPARNWKFTMNDLDNRGLWDTYQSVFSDCLAHTTSESAPWYVIPADSKRNARLIVSHILIETLRSLPLEYPQASEQHLEDLKKAKQQLESEKE